MPRYAAFLRAINVGGRQASKDVLRAACERAGGARVETLLASGNLLFDARGGDERALAAKLEKALAAELGFEVVAFLRSAEEMSTIAARSTALADDEATLFVAFLAAPPAVAAWRRLREAATADDRFDLAGRQVYWLRRGSSADSPFSGPLLEKLLAAPATVRKSTTVLKMASKLAGA